MPCALLIALCEETPLREQVQAWQRQLEQEAHLLPATVSTPTASPVRLDSLPELWVVVPQGASLVSEGSERRFSWEAFFFFLESGRASEESSTSHSPSG